MAESPLPPCSSPFQFKMNSITPEDYEDFLKLILDIVRCCNYDKCNKTLRRPLVQCFNGHGICPDCQSLKKSCPVQGCRKKFRDTRFPLLEGALDALPKKCKFEGCDVLMIPRVDYRHTDFCKSASEGDCVYSELMKPRYDHERWCSLGVVDCKLCEWTGQRKNILTHIKQDHPDTKIYSDKDNEGISWRDLHPSEMNGCSSFVPISVFGNLMWMCITDVPTEKLITVKFIFVPMGNEFTNMHANFVLKNTTNRLVSMVFLHMDSLLEQNEETCSLALHTQAVESFINGPHQVVFVILPEKEIF